MAKVKIKLVKSSIGKVEGQKRTVEALGLKKNWSNYRKRRYSSN